MLADYFKKVKIWCRENSQDLFIAGIIFFTGLSSFGLGRFSAHISQNLPLTVIESVNDPASVLIPVNTIHPQTDIEKSPTSVFASRNGMVYYYTWCSGAKRVKEENRVWFPSSKEAEQAGLTRASTCR